MKLNNEDSFVSKLESIITSNPLILLPFLNTEFAKYFNVSECPLEICEQQPDHTGNTPPARFECWYGNKEKTKISKYHISLAPDAYGNIYNTDAESFYSVFRVVKLFSHEWMHYYAFLAESQIISQDQIAHKYKDKILLSFHHNSKKLNEKYSDKEVLSAQIKLSPWESVSDEFAIDVLSYVLNQTKNEKYKKLIIKQINAHNTQVDQCLALLESKGVALSNKNYPSK